VRLGGAAWSPDGKQILYTGNASGRINLWLMNADGTGAHQLLHSDDAQSRAIWSKDGSVVYQQDRGGDEIYDLYTVTAAGGTSQALAQTEQISETNPHFSPMASCWPFSIKRSRDRLSTWP
jgi:Tol biopolymer transport system component